MTDNYILVGAQRQAQLEAAKAAFFASGGAVSVIAGCSFAAPAQRNHPEPIVKAIAPRTPKPEPPITAMMRRNEKIADMAETMTCSDIAEAMGLSTKSLREIARRLGIKFVPAGPGRAAKPLGEYHSLAERIAALSRTGTSKNKAAKHLRITPRLLSRIAKEFGIYFATCVIEPK